MSYACLEYNDVSALRCCTAQASNVLQQPLSEAKISHMHSGPPPKRDERGALIIEKNQGIVHNLCPGTSSSYATTAAAALLLLL
jgi:hypothetical protein